MWVKPGTFQSVEVKAEEVTLKVEGGVFGGVRRTRKAK